MSAKSSRRALLKLAVGAGQLALLEKMGLNPLSLRGARADTGRAPTKVMTIMVTGGWQPWYFFNPLKLSEVETFLPRPRISVPLQEPMYCVRSQVAKNLDGTEAVDPASPGAPRPLRVPRLWDEVNLPSIGRDLRNAHPATGLITCPFGYSWAHAPSRLWENAVVVHGVDQGTPAHLAGKIAALCGYAGQDFKDPGIHAVVANAMLDRFPNRPLPAVSIGESLASSRGNLPAETDPTGIGDVGDLAAYLSETSDASWRGLRGSRTSKPQLSLSGRDLGTGPTHPIDDFALAELRRMHGKTNTSTDAFLQRLYDGYLSTSKTLASDVVNKVAAQAAFEHTTPVPWGFGGEYFGFSSGGSNKGGFGGTEDFALALKLLKADVTSAIGMSLRVPIAAGGGYFDTHGGEDFNWPWQFLVMEMIGRFVAELKLTPASSGGGSMLDETLIMVVSDFSRTWPINGISDHWPVTSVVYIGGNVLSGNRMIGAYDVSSRPPNSDGFEGVAIDLKDEKGDTQRRAPRAHDTVYSAYRLLGIDRFMSDGPGEIIVCARAPELRLATLAALLVTGCSAPSARFEAAMPVELLANVDDDDRDGVRDALDERLNGEADLDDLTRVTLSTRCEGQALELHLEPAEHVRVFHSIDGRWEPLLGGERHHAPAACGETVLLIEALRPRSQVWSGAATLWVRAARVSAVLARLELSVVPVIFPDVTKPAARIYAVDIDEAEAKPNHSTLASLTRAAGRVPLSLARGADYHFERWMQDAVSAGVQRRSQPAQQLETLLEMDRATGDFGLGSFAAKQLGPNRGLVRPGRDEPNLLSYGGNLEVIPPHPGFPLGRLVIGGGGARHMGASTRAWLDAQRAQGPVLELSTEWLETGHIDELIAFVPTHSGWQVVIASPRRARARLEQLAASGSRGLRLKSRDGSRSVEQLLADQTLWAVNEEAQRRLDGVARTLTEATDQAATFIEVPQLFEPSATASNQVVALHPSQVSLVVLQHTVVLMTADEEGDVFDSTVRASLASVGLSTEFVNDTQAYHALGGGLHCGVEVQRSL